MPASEYLDSFVSSASALIYGGALIYSPEVPLPWYLVWQVFFVFHIFKIFWQPVT